MKKSILIICLLFLSFSLFAQGNVRFGFTTSPGVSFYSGDSKVQNTKGARFTFNYGAVVDFILDNNERYAITSGLTIDMNGGKIEATPLTKEEGSFSKLTTKNQYLEIPVGLKLRSNETSNNLTFYGVLGIVNGFRIRSRGKYEFNQVYKEARMEGNQEYNISISESNIKIKDLAFFPSNIKKVNPYHLSLHFEAGTEFRVSDNTSIIGGLYFRNGFTNVIKDEDNDRIVARGLGLRIAVMF
ncbi:MAG: PorT family protein [Chitinophagales bacterium]|nr:PorT family protein [Chitinophagales bacterium]